MLSTIRQKMQERKVKKIYKKHHPREIPKMDEKDKEVKVVKASYDSKEEWKQDPLGYFTLKPFYNEQVIRVRFYNNNNERLMLIEGDKAIDIYNTICRLGIISMVEHAAYLGAELQKAEIAMKKHLPYVQDEDLEF
jgi:hypothetical protein